MGVFFNLILYQYIPLNVTNWTFMKDKISFVFKVVKKRTQTLYRSWQRVQQWETNPSHRMTQMQLVTLDAIFNINKKVALIITQNQKCVTMLTFALGYIYRTRKLSRVNTFLIYHFLAGLAVLPRTHFPGSDSVRVVKLKQKMP